MSEQTFEEMEQQAPAQPERRSRRRKAAAFPHLELDFDVPLLMAIFALLLFGALMVYSASWDFSLVNYEDPTQMFFQQMRNMVVGLAAAVACAFLHYHFWRKYSVFMMGGMLLALTAVLVYGEVRYGSARALSAGSYMPGELAKLVTIIYLSVWLFAKRAELKKVTYGLVPLICILGLMAGLIFMQPDISAAATIVLLGGLLFFLAGGSLLQIGAMLGGGAALGLLVMQISLTAQTRITDYLTGLGNPTLANDHVLRAYEAFVKGGWFGVGLGQSETKLTGLPVPPTDSIFAVIGEELGLFGIFITLLFYGLILWRGMLIARRAPDMFGSLLAAGITLWITLEAFINMAVMVGLVPFAGNTLPLVSFGGSSLVTTLAALGILMNISRVSRTQRQQEERILDATARGRWGERGGVYPALAVLQELGDEDLELLWVGGEGGMEEDLVSRAGYQLRAIPAAGLHGVGLSKLPRNLWHLARGYFAARRLLAEFHPDVLFFTGGFVAAPVALAGRRVPTLVFVPDLQPGLALRMIARAADVVAIVAEEARKYFRRPDRVQVTGYPLRSEITRWTRSEAIKHFGLSSEIPTLLAFGGSKGARSINQATLAALPSLLEHMQVIHIAGEGNWAVVSAAASGLPANLAGRYHAFPYLHGDMGAAFAAADLALCRAGASTLGELPHFKLPAVLVPIPLKGHLQRVNAAYLEQRGAALILADDQMKDSLVTTIVTLIQDQPRLQAMGAAMTALAQPNATADIAGLLRTMGSRAATNELRSEA